MIRTTAEDGQSFAQAFNDAVAISASPVVDSSAMLEAMSSNKLGLLRKYFATDKARHSDKVKHIASQTPVSINLSTVVKKLTSARETFEARTSEDLWTKATVGNVFDPGEIRCMMRTAETKAKDTSEHSLDVIPIIGYVIPDTYPGARHHRVCKYLHTLCKNLHTLCKYFHHSPLKSAFYPESPRM